MQTTRHFNVRFDPAAVRAIVAPHQVDAQIKPRPEEVAPANKGGAPRKEWWDDFWIEICRKIYDNELKNIQKQADIERAMHDWVSVQGFDVGETTIKNAARKLFKAWKLGGTKT
jgi:hypothetical protein